MHLYIAYVLTVYVGLAQARPNKDIAVMLFCSNDVGHSKILRFFHYFSAVEKTLVALLSITLLGLVACASDHYSRWMQMCSAVLIAAVLALHSQLEAVETDIPVLHSSLHVPSVCTGTNTLVETVSYCSSLVSVC